MTLYTELLAAVPHRTDRAVGADLHRAMVTCYSPGTRPATIGTVCSWLAHGRVGGANTNGTKIVNPEHGDALRACASQWLPDTQVLRWLFEFDVAIGETLRLPKGSGPRSTDRDVLLPLLDLIGAEGRIPRIAEIDLGAHQWYQRSFITGGEVPHYVPRPALHQQLDQLFDQAERSDSLGWHRFVVATGEPKVGKTRTVLEVLKARYPESPLLIPLRIDRLDAVIVGLEGRSIGRANRPAVLLLDDLQRALGDNPTFGQTLRAIPTRIPHLIIVATIHHRMLAIESRELDRELAEIGLPREIRQSLVSRSVTVPTDLAPVDLNDSEAFLNQVVPGRATTRQLVRRFAYTLASVDTLIGIWRDAHNHSRAVDCVRSALLDALMDAWFIFPTGVADGELRTLANARFAATWPDRHQLSDAQYQAGCEWLLEPDPAQPYSFDVPRDGGHRLHDGVTDALAEHHTVSHDLVLTAAQGSQIGDQMFAIDQSIEAEYWWSQAATSGSTNAMYNLGVLRTEQDRIDGPDGAERWWTSAARVGHASAMNSLGALRNKHDLITGDDSAEHWWTAAAWLGHANAMYNLGLLRNSQQRTTGDDSAERWWISAADRGHANAMYNLGVLRTEQRRIDGLDSAEHWYHLAALSGHTNAMYNLGVLRNRQHRRVGVDGSEHWWTLAADAGHVNAASSLTALRTSG